MYSLKKEVNVVSWRNLRDEFKCSLGCHWIIEIKRVIRDPF